MCKYTQSAEGDTDIRCTNANCNQLVSAETTCKQWHSLRNEWSPEVYFEIFVHQSKEFWNSRAMADPGQIGKIAEMCLRMLWCQKTRKHSQNDGDTSQTLGAHSWELQKSMAMWAAKEAIITINSWN